MTTQAYPSLDSSKVALRLGMCAAALAGTAAVAPDAQASVVTFNTPIVVPNTFDGIYINFLTGATGSTSPTVAGWDFDPYNSGTSLSLFWNPTPSQAGGGVAGTTTGPYLDLGAGSVISSASTFATATDTTNTAAFQSTGNHTLGFRFFNETTAAINYGYATLSVGAGTGNGFPLTISGWSFENTGAAITVGGAVPAVPEPSTYALMTLGALAIGAMNLRKVRRQRRLTS